MPKPLDEIFAAIKSPECTSDIRLEALLEEVENPTKPTPLINELVDAHVGKPEYQLALTEEQQEEWHHDWYYAYEEIAKAVRFEAARRWLAHRKAS